MNISLQVRSSGKTNQPLIFVDTELHLHLPAALRQVCLFEKSVTNNSFSLIRTWKDPRVPSRTGKRNLPQLEGLRHAGTTSRYLNLFHNCLGAPGCSSSERLDVFHQVFISQPNQASSVYVRLEEQNSFGCGVTFF